MKPLILLFAATAIIGAAPARPAAPAPRAAPYEAGGFEPSWQLRIDRGRLIYDSGTGEPVINIPVPRRQAVRNGYRYVSRQLTVDVRHVRCDSYDGRTFADTVRPSLAFEAGCGGRAIAPATLTASIWEVGRINGTSFGHGDTNLLFAWDGVVRGSAGCSDFSVPFTERRPFVRFGRMTVSRRDCPGLGLERERRALEIFSGTSRIGFVDGDTLILTGHYGTARLNPD